MGVIAPIAGRSEPIGFMIDRFAPPYDFGSTYPGA